MTELEELRQEADDLGIEYGKTVGAARLKAKIDAYYDSQETSGPIVQEAVKEKTQTESRSFVPTKDIYGGRTPEEITRLSREREARKTRVITIIDNDQRQNNQTTTCTVNNTNEHFDLGTRTLPLNEKVEVAMGHINVLRNIKIPLHTKDPKTGLAVVRVRPRYTISYEDIKTD